MPRSVRNRELPSQTHFTAMSRVSASSRLPQHTSPAPSLPLPLLACSSQYHPIYFTSQCIPSVASRHLHILASGPAHPYRVIKIRPECTSNAAHQTHSPHASPCDRRVSSSPADTPHGDTARVSYQKTSSEHLLQPMIYRSCYPSSRYRCQPDRWTACWDSVVSDG